MKDKNNTHQNKPDSNDQKKTKSTIRSPKELGGPKGPEPTRYGDWERRGRCIDF